MKTEDDREHDDMKRLQPLFLPFTKKEDREKYVRAQEEKSSEEKQRDKDSAIKELAWHCANYAHCIGGIIKMKQVMKSIGDKNPFDCAFAESDVAFFLLVLEVHWRHWQKMREEPSKKMTIEQVESIVDFGPRKHNGILASYEGVQRFGEVEEKIRESGVSKKDDPANQLFTSEFLRLWEEKEGKAKRRAVGDLHGPTKVQRVSDRATSFALDS